MAHKPALLKCLQTLVCRSVWFIQALMPSVKHEEGGWICQKGEEKSLDESEVGLAVQKASSFQLLTFRFKVRFSFWNKRNVICTNTDTSASEMSTSHSHGPLHPPLCSSLKLGTCHGLSCSGWMFLLSPKAMSPLRLPVHERLPRELFTTIGNKHMHANESLESASLDVSDFSKTV